MRKQLTLVLGGALREEQACPGPGRRGPARPFRGHRSGGRSEGLPASVGKWRPSGVRDCELEGPVGPAPIPETLGDGDDLILNARYGRRLPVLQRSGPTSSTAPPAPRGQGRLRGGISRQSESPAEPRQEARLALRHVPRGRHCLFRGHGFPAGRWVSSVRIQAGCLRLPQGKRRRGGPCFQGCTRSRRPLLRCLAPLRPDGGRPG